MSTTGGFEFYLQDRSGGSLDSLAEAARRVVAGRQPAARAAAASRTHVHDRRAAIPDRRRPREGQGDRRSDQRRSSTRCRARSAASTSTTSRCSAAPIASACRPRPSSARRPDDLRHVFVRSDNGAMVPLNALVTVDAHRRSGHGRSLQRLSGRQDPRQSGAGLSSGQAIAAMQQVVAATLPTDYTIGWTGSAYQEMSTAGTGYLGLRLRPRHGVPDPGGAV